MVRKLSIIFAVLTIVSMLLVPIAYADGSITGTVYGNGSVSVTEGEGGITFMLTPGTANELKSFTVDGSKVEVTDNKATVSSASTYEAVFEGKAQEITRETPKVIMENGVVSSVNGTNNNAQDSANNLIIRKTGGNGTNPAVSQYGYEMTRTNSRSDNMQMWRDPWNGGLCKIAVGRTYTPKLYFKNDNPTGSRVDMVIQQLTVDGNIYKYSDENSFKQEGLINGSWDPLGSGRMDIANPNTDGTFVYTAKKSFTVNTLTEKSDNSVSIVSSPSDWFMVRRFQFTQPGIDGYSSDKITSRIFIQGASFNEKVSYHAVTANIGEGEMAFSSESLNFGKDNDSVKVKDGVALAVEDNRPATFTVTAPSGKTVKEVNFGDDVLTASEGVYTIPYVSADGAITVAYEDDASAVPSEYDKKFDFSAYDSSAESQVGSLTPYANGTVTFEFYDNGVTGGLVAFKDGSNILREYLKLYADGKYTFTALDGTAKINEKEVKLDRTSGAHTVVIKTFGDSYDVYLDNNLVHSITLAENSIGVRDIYVQNKDGKYTAGTPHELYYKTLTSAENKPAVSATSVIADSTYNGQPSAVIYAKVEGDAKSAGIILKDSAGHELTLNAYNSDDSLVTTGAFGIRVFGAAMVSGSEYKYIPFAEYTGGSVNADEQTFTLK